MGVTHLKLKVAENSALDVTKLPYNVPFINWLKEQKVGGETCVLHSRKRAYWQAVYEHLDFLMILSRVMHTNLKSNNKRIALQRKYGEKAINMPEIVTQT